MFTSTSDCWIVVFEPWDFPRFELRGRLERLNIRLGRKPMRVRPKKSGQKKQPAQLCFVSSADLRCPNCNSTNLKKVSLVYQQGLSHTVAHTRQRAVAVGCGLGFLIGTATTRGVHQSVLSKQLSPPVKWPYRKLVLWWAVVSGSIGWIVFYITSFMKTFFYCFVASVDSFL
jgi:hypothetical protein